MNILYLEDNKGDCELFGLYAKQLLGATVVCAGNYTEYRRAINSQEHFDAIVCDYKVPGFDGLSAIDIAKQERPGVPVIFITGARLDLIPKAKNSGADYAVEKRGFMDLIVVLRECCSKK